MSIITYSDFKTGQKIANVNNVGTMENLNDFIEEYEPKFLKSLLGLTLYNEMVAGLSADPVEAKWTTLSDLCKPMIVRYVYFWYKRDETTHSLGTGEGKSKNENSSQASSVDKQVKSWNEMVEMVRGFELDKAIYNGWSPYWINKFYMGGYARFFDPDYERYAIYYPINSLNI